jgi:replicative DNA helicase
VKDDDFFVSESVPERAEITVSGPPANVDAERTILGAILLDNEAWLEASEFIKAEDFSLDSHRRIFLRMSELANSERVVDIVTLANELNKNKEVESIGGVAYLASLTEGLPRRPVIDEYIRIVKDRAMLRSLITIGTQAIRRVEDQSEEALELISITESMLTDLIEGSGSMERGGIDVSNVTVEALNEFESRRNSSDHDSLPYGMPVELDELTGGMFEGEVTVIGGESGVGKSSAMVQAIVRTCRRGKKTVCYSLEMTNHQLLGKIWSIESGVPYRFIRFPKIASEEQANLVRSAAMRVAEWPLKIYDRGGMTLSEIISTARLHIKRHDARLIAIDYLQRITVIGPKDERLKVAEASKKIADLVKNTRCHALLLSQLRRREDNTIPTKSDLRESGQIENDAHCILLFWREYDKEKGDYMENGLIVIPKQRFGFTGNVKTVFNRDYAIYE